jgi:hypothetical protein
MKSLDLTINKLVKIIAIIQGYLYITLWVNSPRQVPHDLIWGYELFPYLLLEFIVDLRRYSNTKVDPCYHPSELKPIGNDLTLETL